MQRRRRVCQRMCATCCLCVPCVDVAAGDCTLSNQARSLKPATAAYTRQAPFSHLSKSPGKQPVLPFWLRPPQLLWGDPPTASSHGGKRLSKLFWLRFASRRKQAALGAAVQAGLGARLLFRWFWCAGEFWASWRKALGRKLPGLGHLGHFGHFGHILTFSGLRTVSRRGRTSRNRTSLHFRFTSRGWDTV